MAEVTLVVQTPEETVELPLEGDSLSVGRGEQAALVISDAGLSRLHATIHREGDTVWIVDESSTNGTFVNNAAVPPDGALLADGDQIAIGDHTTITVLIRGGAYNAAQPYGAAQKGSGFQLSPPPLVALFVTFIILAVAVAALGFYALSGGVETNEVVVTNDNGEPGGENRNENQQVAQVTPTPASEMIDEYDILEELPKLEDIKDVDLRKAVEQARADRGAAMGVAAGVEVPQELQPVGGFLNIQASYALRRRIPRPHDYGDLAGMILRNEISELKPLGEHYVVDGVGEMTTTDPFTHYDLESGQGGLPLPPEEKKDLEELARDFGGRAYDLNNPADRKEFKRRMLHAIRPAAKEILELLAERYYKKFNRRLRVSSLIRTIEYQRQLSRSNANAARNDVPPHTIGLTFDIGFGFMSAPEQVFLMREIANLEAQGKVEALREGNNCYHVFVFIDKQRPKQDRTSRT